MKSETKMALRKLIATEIRKCEHRGDSGMKEEWISTLDEFNEFFSDSKFKKEDVKKAVEASMKDQQRIVGIKPFQKYFEEEAEFRRDGVSAWDSAVQRMLNDHAKKIAELEDRVLELEKQLFLNKNRHGKNT